MGASGLASSFSARRNAFSAAFCFFASSAAAFALLAVSAGLSFVVAMTAGVLDAFEDLLLESPLGCESVTCDSLPFVFGVGEGMLKVGALGLSGESLDDTVWSAIFSRVGFALGQLHVMPLRTLM